MTMGPISCHPPTVDQIPALVDLDLRTLGGLWSADGYRRELESPNSCMLVLTQHHKRLRPGILSKSTMAEPGVDERIVGLGCYWAILDEAHLTVLAVDPRYQRRGLGQWLLIHLLEDACHCRPTQADDCPLTRATLEVRPSNSRAVALYTGFGFEPLGHRRRYYPDGEDALILWQNSLKTREFKELLAFKRSTVKQRLQAQGWQISAQKQTVNHP